MKIQKHIKEQVKTPKDIIKVFPENKYRLINGLLAEELLKFIQEVNKKNEDKLGKEDLAEIAKLLLPDIDILISTKIKLHMKLLGEKLIEQSR